MALTFDKINDLTGAGGIIGTDLLGSSRIRDSLSIGKNLTVTENISLNGAINGSSVLDDDTFETATATALATSKSIKAYSDTKALATYESIKAYSDTNQYHYVRSAFNYSSSAGTQIVLPLDGTTIPKTTFAGFLENTCMLAPFDGSLETILFRSEEVAGVTIMGFHKATTGTEVPAMLAIQTVTVDMSAVADDTTTAFNFTSANTFSAGDVLGFTCDPANDVDDCLCVIILKYDTTSGV